MRPQVTGRHDRRSGVRGSASDPVQGSAIPGDGPMYLTSKARRSPLPPEAYYAERYARIERDGLFSNSWLLVGFARSLRSVGDYFTARIVGMPVIVWRTVHGIRAFVNICAHRGCTVVLDQVGNATSLRCPYHGWQYDADGRVSRIPDAWSFAPYNKVGTHRLRPLDSEECGALLFVRMGSNAPQSLRGFLGETQFKILQTVFPSDGEPFHVRRRLLRCNWKLALENAMEDLHTPFLHQDTFGSGFSQVALDDFWTQSLEDGAQGVMGGAGPFAAATKPPGLWESHNVLDIFPGMHFLWGPGSVATAESWYPQTPEATARTSYLTVFPGLRLRPKRTAAHRQEAIRFFETVAKEDEALLPELQRNMRHTGQRALVGVREERLHYFHEYLASAYEAG